MNNTFTPQEIEDATKEIMKFSLGTFAKMVANHLYPEGKDSYTVEEIKDAANEAMYHGHKVLGNLLEEWFTPDD